MPDPKTDKLTTLHLGDVGLAQLWGDLPRAGEWYERIQARAAFGKTFCPGSRYGARGSDPAVAAGGANAVGKRA
jgi:hypothetical protein